MEKPRLPPLAETDMNDAQRAVYRTMFKSM